MPGCYAAWPDLVQRSLACSLAVSPGGAFCRSCPVCKSATAGVAEAGGKFAWSASPGVGRRRDGIMIPMRSGGYEKRAATVSVYDYGRRRLGTIYVGQMPEAKQATLSGTLTQLLRATLEDWHGPLPRLAYITDKGSACDEYYHDVLKKMKHPRDGKLLAWEWVLDFLARVRSP